MDDADLVRLCDAAKRLPALMVTLAPEGATGAQIAALRRAGAIVSLGHSDCTAGAAQAAIAAGATCATHLFNAMSQMANREPGLAGTVLDSRIPAGLIADGLHVAPQVMRVALAARHDGLFLVSDAMSVAGTALGEFRLGGRRIIRTGGRLALEDGTLAGADLSLPQAVAVLVAAGIAHRRALAMATSVPAAVIGRAGERGAIAPGRPADLVHLADDWRLAQVWRAGEALL